MRVIVAGATGLIGRALCRDLRDEYELVVLTRDARRAATRMSSTEARILREDSAVVEWDARTISGWGRQVDGAYAVVNLAGENLADGRWTRSRKMTILQSRTNSANAIVEAVEASRNKPTVVIQASAVGYYGSRGNEMLDEEAVPGHGLLAEVCRRTESIAARVGRQGVRHVALRTGIVLSREAGALPRFVRPFRFFLGGRVGHPHQWLSWISLQDAVRAIRFLMEHRALTGPVNLVAPEPVTIRQFSQVLGRVLRRPAWTAVPAFAARLLFGEMANEMLLASQRVVPKRLVDAGFGFECPDLATALEAVLKAESNKSC